MIQTQAPEALRKALQGWIVESARCDRCQARAGGEVYRIDAKLGQGGMGVVYLYLYRFARSQSEPALQ